MNENERLLLRLVCDGDIMKAQTQAKIILQNVNTQKDTNFKEQLLRKLENAEKVKRLMPLPPNMQDMLVAEDVSETFPVNRFLKREKEEQIVDKLLNIRKAAEKLTELGIPYLPTLLLHGETGTGKTMLAKYIAYKAELPFVYARFSGVLDSYLGKSLSNLAHIFDYARRTPCVLCLDEIDAIGMARGRSANESEVGEMSRVTIQLMQELDRSAFSNIIVVGTTNRFDRLDPALVRRFTMKRELYKMSKDEACRCCEMFFQSVGMCPEDKTGVWLRDSFGPDVDAFSASELTNKCTEYIVQRICEENEEPNQ